MDYVKPTMEFIQYESKDIITASGATTKNNSTTLTACTNGTGTGKTDVWKHDNDHRTWDKNNKI